MNQDFKQGFERGLLVASRFLVKTSEDYHEMSRRELENAEKSPFPERHRVTARTYNAQAVLLEGQAKQVLLIDQRV